MDKDAQQAVITATDSDIRDIVSAEFKAMYDRITAQLEARWPGLTDPANRVTGHLMRRALHDTFAFVTGHIERSIMETSEVKGPTLVSARNHAAKNGRQVSMLSEAADRA